MTAFLFSAAGTVRRLASMLALSIAVAGCASTNTAQDVIYIPTDNGVEALRVSVGPVAGAAEEPEEEEASATVAVELSRRVPRRPIFRIAENYLTEDRSRIRFLPDPELIDVLDGTNPIELLGWCRSIYEYRLSVPHAFELLCSYDNIRSLEVLLSIQLNYRHCIPRQFLNRSQSDSAVRCVLEFPGEERLRQLSEGDAATIMRFFAFSSGVAYCGPRDRSECLLPESTPSWFPDYDVWSSPHDILHRIAQDIDRRSRGLGSAHRSYRFDARVNWMRSQCEIRLSSLRTGLPRLDRAEAILCRAYLPR